MKKATKRKESVQSKKWYPQHKFFDVLFSVTRSFLLGFSWSSDSITASNKNCTFKKEPTSVSEITIQNLRKNIKIPLLCQCGLFINAEVSKNSIGLKMWFSTSVDITWYAEAAIYAKKSFPLSFYSSLVKFTEWHRGSGRVKLWQSWMRWKMPLCKWHTFLNDPMFNLLF